MWTSPIRESPYSGSEYRIYSKQPALRRRCWDWLLNTARKMAARPFIIAGDLNTDPRYPKARCGGRIGQLIEAGFTHASPALGASYWSLRGHGVRIDHAFTSKSLTVLGAQYVTQVGDHVLVGSHDAYSDHAALLVDVRMRPPERPPPVSPPCRPDKRRDTVTASAAEGGTDHSR